MRMTRTRDACLPMLVSFVCVSISLASEQIPIGTILEHPESYNAHSVTLQGVARRVQSLGPRVGDCPFYDAYKFVLQDDTGSLEIEVPGPCAKPAGTMVPVSEGDKVVVQAQIGVLRSDRLPPPVIGIARSIRRLG